MHLRGLLIIAAWLGFTVAVLVAAERQAHQLDRIEEAAGSCVVSVDACEPADVEPAAPDAVRIAVAETGADVWRIGPTRILAQPGVSALERSWSEYIDVLLGPDSLATAGVCAAWLAGTPCPETDATWRSSSTAAQYVCRGRGSGISRDGSRRVIDGAHISYRFADTSTCPGQHNDCALILTMTRAQYHVIRAAALDDDAGYPAALKAIIDAMRADPRRTNNLATAPACIDGLSVRAGRSDLNPPAAED
jgi:hypothetical protein